MNWLNQKHKDGKTWAQSLKFWLLIILLVVLVAILTSCSKQKEDIYYLSVTEYIDSIGTNVTKTHVSLHWHEKRYENDPRGYHKDSLTRYWYLNGQRFAVCPPLPIYSRWVVGKDTCNY